MPYIDECITRREFGTKWVSNARVEVLEYVVSVEDRMLVGTVFVGTGVDAESQANKYIGSRVGGLSLVSGQVVCSKLATKYDRAMQSLFLEVVK